MVSNEVILRVANQVRRRYDKGDLTKDLACKCAVVSASLSRALRRRGIRHRIHYAGKIDTHVFIAVNGYLLDLTAKQFDYRFEPIVFRRLNKREKNWYWKTAHTFTNEKDLISFQRRVKWPKSQIHPKFG